MLQRVLVISTTLFFLIFSTSSNAVTLDDLFVNVQKCEFKNFYYADWGNESVHPFFAERKLKPYKNQDKSAIFYFKVKEKLFGLPVSEVVVPGTWDFHGVVFDVPLAQVRKVLKRKFGSEFRPSTKGKDGVVPVLDQDDKDHNKSVLYCNERDSGE